MSAELSSLFIDLGIIVIAAAVIGYIARLLKQPLIPAYIVSGMILVPLVNAFLPGVISLSAEVISILKVLAEVGIAFLLFTVGLDFNFKRLKSVGSVATFGTILTFAIVFLAGYLVSIAFGFLTLEAAYMGLIVALSSTLVVIKLLSDKQELDTVHARVIIGMLLMQDVIAVIAIAVLKSINNFSFMELLTTFQWGALLIIVALLLAKFVFPRVFRFAARNQELLFVLSLSVCFLFALLFDLAGFSIAIGAFIGGIVLGNLPYHLEIAGKIKPLKDFFLVLFFVSIGAQFVGFQFGQYWLPLVLFLVIIMFLKPFITMFVTGLFKYKKRTYTLTGLNLGQVSEFSIIIALQGLALGHISQDLYSIVIFLALLTITGTTYFIKYDEWLYRTVLKHFTFFQRKQPNDHIPASTLAEPPSIILIGGDRAGHSILKTVQKLKKSYLVIDFNPDIIKKLETHKVPCLYGDIGDPEIMDTLPLEQVSMIVSTVPDMQDNLILLSHVKKRNPALSIILTATSVHDALELYESGAHYVVIPHHLGGEHVSLLLEEHAEDAEKLIVKKISHMKELHLRIDPHSK